MEVNYGVVDKKVSFLVVDQSNLRFNSSSDRSTGPLVGRIS
jgi:hypothetical protein